VGRTPLRGQIHTDGLEGLFENRGALQRHS